MYVSPISALFAGGKSTPAKRAISGYPCLCLCFGLTQITRTTPRRWITLHLSQIFFTDARTFMPLCSSLLLQNAEIKFALTAPIYIDTQSGRASNRKARAPPQVCLPPECG